MARWSILLLLALGLGSTARRADGRLWLIGIPIYVR